MPRLIRSAAPTPLRWVEAALSVLPRGVTRLRQNPPPERRALVLLVLLSLAIMVVGSLSRSQVVPSSLQVIPLLGGALLLRRRAMRLLMVVVAVALVVDLDNDELWMVPGALITVAITAATGYEFSRSREETGLAGSSGDTFLVEMKDRLQRQGELPALPGGWSAEAVLRPAGGGPFAGDFVVSSLTGCGRRLELALVDVSGKGVDAGTRALLLSGALGGLLGSLQPQDFLPAANRYLDRQDWEEGFATAVHLVLDLDNGAYAVESAGHPPAAHFDAGTGRWSLLTAEGLALGLLTETTYTAQTGHLDIGDALLLFTDGLVEIPGRDLDVGIDKLLGEAERLVPRGFTGGGELLVSRVAGGSTDDRGLVLIWRDR